MNCKSMGCVAGCIATGLVVVGAINWGLVGAFDYNLIGHLLGDKTMYANIIYDLVGLAGVYLAVKKVICCKKSCGVKGH